MYVVAQVGNSFIETDKLPDGSPLERFAHLFAAAPELYDALENMVDLAEKMADVADYPSLDRETIRDARSLLMRAKR